MMYEEEPLKDYYTLMDIAYIYTWRRVISSPTLAGGCPVVAGQGRALTGASLCLAERPSAPQVQSATHLQENEDWSPEGRLE